MAVTTRWGSILFALALGCSSATPEPAVPAPDTAVIPPAPEPGPADAGPAVSEVEARSLLNRMFRGAGLRIVNDHAFHSSDVEVTLDGYDPERGVGYEYVAREEEGTDLSAEELVALEKVAGIFTATGGSLEQLQEQARVFLSALPTQEQALGHSNSQR